MQDFEGIIPHVLKDTKVNYDPSRGITIKEIAETLDSYHKQYCERRKNGWQPEYYLSMQEAKELPLEWLNWFGNNYRVIVSLEISNIIKEREAHL